MVRFFVVCAAALAVLPLYAVGAQATGRTPPIGCYSVVLGAWSRSLGADERYHAVPPHIRLDTAGQLSPNIAYPYPKGFRPRWALRGDTLTLAWSNGFAPTTVTVHRRDSLLIGEAIARSDAVPLGPPHWPHAPATLRREPCGSPPPSSR